MKYLFYSILILSFFNCFKFTQSGVYSIDFKNFTYQMVCGEEGKTNSVKILNGKYNGKIDGFRTHIQINDIKYGDLNGDGEDEAVIQYMCGSGASGAYLGGLIYKAKNDKASFINIIGGDKSNNGLIDVRIENEVLIVKNAQSSMGHACCEVAVKTSKYKLKDDKLVLVESPKIQEIKEAN